MTSVKVVKLALVSYIDNDGLEHTQLAVLGDNTVLLGSGKEFNLSGLRTEPSGVATGWLRDGVLATVNKDE